MANMTSPAEIDLGPRVGEFFRTCMEERPALFIFAWASSAFCALLTCIMACDHAARLRAGPICLQRGYYMRILAFPVCIGVSGFLSCIAPRAYMLAFLVQGQVEAITISTFGIVLFMLLSHESMRHLAEEGRLGENEGVALAIARVLAEQGPRPHFATPPFFCCFRRCFPWHHMRPKHLLGVSWLVRQYAYLTFILSILSLWAALAFKPAMAIWANSVFKMVTKVSGLLAVYGLFVMYFATHDILHEWNTTRKFFSFKFVIILSILQEHLIKVYLTHAREGAGRSCLSGHGEEEIEPSVHFWSQWLLTVESVLMAALMRLAFPADEVQDFQQHHLDLVELELARLDRDSKVLDIEYMQPDVELVNSSSDESSYA